LLPTHQSRPNPINPQAAITMVIARKYLCRIANLLSDLATHAACTVRTRVIVLQSERRAVRLTPKAVA
jgi:hypothetical protein